MLAIPFTVEGESQVQTLWARWAPPKNGNPAARQPVKTRGSWDLRPERSAFEVEQVPAAPAIPANNPEPGQTGPDAKQTKNGDVAAVGDKAVAPPAAAAADGSQKRACISHRKIPGEVTVTEVPTDGDCLLHCVAQGLQRLDKSSKLRSVLEMRAELVAHLRKHADRYSKQFDYELPSRQTAKTFEEYLEAITPVGVWLGPMEMEALSRMFGFRLICVPLSTELHPFALHLKQKKRCVAVRFNGSHFDLLVPKETDGAYPKSLLDIKEGPPVVPMRGGGADDCASSRFQPSFCKARALSRAGKAPTEWSSQMTSSGASSTSSVQDVLTETTTAVEQAPKQEPRPSQFACKNGWFIWPCELCPYVARSRNKHFCNQHRYAHCHKIHGGAGLPGRVSGAKIPVQRVTKKQNVAWKCPCCACGILQTDAVGQTVGALVRVKRLHRETQHPEISPQQWNRLHRARAAQKVTHRVKQRAGNLNASVARAGVVERSVWTPFQMPSLANKNSTITLPRAFQCKACRAIKYSIPATNAHECTRTVLPTRKAWIKAKQKQLVIAKRLIKQGAAGAGGLSMSLVCDLFQRGIRALKRGTLEP